MSAHIAECACSECTTARLGGGPMLRDVEGPVLRAGAASCDHRGSGVVTLASVQNADGSRSTHERCPCGVDLARLYVRDASRRIVVMAREVEGAMREPSGWRGSPRHHEGGAEWTDRTVPADNPVDRVYVVTGVYMDGEIIESVEPSVFVDRDAAQRCADSMIEADPTRVVVFGSAVTVSAAHEIGSCACARCVGLRVDVSASRRDLVELIDACLVESDGEVFTARARMEALRARLVGG